MNRFKMQKYKTGADAIGSSAGGAAGDGSGLLNKLSKRYSTISNKIVIRRQQGGRKSTSPQKTVSGSYDMTGSRSDDHRPEIGAPILISTTTLDADILDVTEARLKQINGGIAVANANVLKVNIHGSPHIPSSGSENEVFVDALSTPPHTARDEQSEEEKFEMALDETPRVEMSDLGETDEATETDSRANLSDRKKENVVKSVELLHDERPRRLSRKEHSKSAQNLHRSELKVFLKKGPSVGSEKKLNQCGTPEFDDNLELPRLPELYGGTSDSSVPTAVGKDDDNCDADKENSTPSLVTPNTTGTSTPNHRAPSKSEPITPVTPELKIVGFLAQQQHFKSIDSLDLHRHHQTSKQRTSIFNSTNSIDQHGSKNSLASHNSSIANFDLKSVSCQSLNAQSLFVSIDELNEITRQINESEDFSQEIDYEYCEHRDNLKPSERRITLLKSKNSHLANFLYNKEKLKKGWNGVKHWIGEESSKLKEAVQSKTAIGSQRVSSSRLNLNNNNNSISPNATPTNKSNAILRNPTVITHSNTNTTADATPRNISRPTSVDRPLTHDNDSHTNSTFNLERVAVPDLENSCINLSQAALDDMDDLDSSFTQTQVGDVSTLSNSKGLKKEGQNGFEELRRYVKQGGDFGKELLLVLQERVDAETLYSKSLTKMAGKLNKACRELPGSIADAWRGVATEMEARSDIHRQLSTSLTDEIVKPLKAIIESHHKSRKTVESNVDKAARTLADWRISEAKGKKTSHTAARENEKLQDAMLDVRIQKSPSIAMLHQGTNKLAAEKEIKSAEKDCAKLDSKRKKAEEAVKRADVEYYTLCIRAERARVDWEMSVLRGSSLLQSIENQRLISMKNFASNYAQLTSNMNPLMDGVIQRLLPLTEACNVVKDMQIVQNIRRNAEGPSEQLLPDFYCEHTTLAMNRERRKHALIKLLQLVKADLERERRSRASLKGLSQSLNNQEAQNITDKLYHIRSMLTYLEGARFKLQSALLELDHKPRSSHPLAQHIQITRDRTGLQQSILKVPLWLKNNDRMASSVCLDENSSIRDDYECVYQLNATNSNVSCTDLSNDGFLKHFVRSKSNVETFSQLKVAQQPQKQQLDKTSTIPANMTNDSTASDLYSDRGQADGGSNQQDSDFDEFSSQDGDEEQQQYNGFTNGHKDYNKPLNGLSGSQQYHHYQNSSEIRDEQCLSHGSQDTSTTVTPSDDSPVVLSRCKALYSYTPKLYDELQLNPGDIIEVHAKQEDGWWLGALGNQIGIFPATYVEEFA